MKTLKKMLVLVVLVLMLGCITLSLTACSKDEYIGGFYCKIKSDNTIAVYVDEYIDEELVIPDTIAGLKVTGVMKPKSKQKVNTILTKVVLPETVRWIEKESFKGCVALSEINLPERMAVIYENAFENCSSLVSIRIPDGVTELGEEAFKGCISLENVYIPASVENMGYAVFEGCPDLEIWIAREKKPWYWVGFGDGVKEVHWNYDGYNNPESGPNE